MTVGLSYGLLVLGLGLVVLLPLSATGVWTLGLGVALLAPAPFLVRALRRREAGGGRVLLIGRNAVAQRLLQALAVRPASAFAVVGVVDDPASTVPDDGPIKVVGCLRELPAIVREVRPDRIVIGLTDRRGHLPVAQLLECAARGVIVEDAATAYERLTGKLAIETLPPSALIAAEGFRAPRWLQATRRGLSFTAAAVGLLFAAPLLAVVAVVVRLDSGRPVLFRQARVGFGGRAFDLIKFRTMCPTDRPVSQWARDNAERITRVGRWLRASRLDELPQLINVLRGDMNLVGPRPHPVSNFDLFLRNIPYYGLRVSVRPGLTGWAQVRYRYANNLEEETEKMRYDLYYIKNRSLLMDLRILAQTAAIILSRRKLAPGQTERTDPIGRTPRAPGTHRAHPSSRAGDAQAAS